MNPMLMFAIALLIPIVIIVMVFLPAYTSLVLALYIQYGEQSLQYKFEFFTTIKLYRRLYEYWETNSAQLDLVEFTLPTIGIPALGILLSLYGTYRLVKYIREIFVLTMD